MRIQRKFDCCDELSLKSKASDEARTRVSFTPGFSHVSRAPRLNGNRLNGFQSKGCSAITWLKPCVNKKKEIFLRQSLCDD
jgi:hypothetical protein